MLLFVLVVALGLGADPACTADADCVVAHDCPCSCCPAQPEAMTKARAADVRSKCARLGPCAPPEPQCAAVRCAGPVPESAFVAKCVQSACVLERKQAAKK
ncbi:MAG: hypothetical protein U0228_33345 [Myxococcaceae bacterium]